MNLKPIPLVLVFLLFSCKGDRGPVGPPGQPLSGDIAGRVTLTPPSGASSTDMSGVTVSIEPSSISTTTLSDGSWTLKNVPAGIYDFTYFKPGYFVEKDFNLQFVGGGTLFRGYRSLYGVPLDTIIQLLGSFISSSGLLHFEGTISPLDSTHRYVVLITSKIAISTTIPLYIGIYDLHYVEIYATQHFETYISAYNVQLVPGDTAYAVAFVGARIGETGVNLNPKIMTWEFDTPDIAFSNMATVVVQ